MTGNLCHCRLITGSTHASRLVVVQRCLQVLTGVPGHLTEGAGLKLTETHALWMSIQEVLTWMVWIVHVCQCGGRKRSCGKRGRNDADFGRAGRRALPKEENLRP